MHRITLRLNLSKTTIYYHVRKNFGRKIRELRIDDRPTADLGELLGVFAADGNFLFDAEGYEYKIAIDLTDYQTEYAEILAGIIERIFGKRPRVRLDRKRHTINVRLYGKAIYSLLRQFLWWGENKTHSIAFKRSSFRLGKAFLRGVVRGLVAGDGSVSIRNNCISFGVTSKRLAKQYAEMLSIFGIESHWYTPKRRRSRAPCHSVTIRGDMLKQFKTNIGLTDPVRARLLAVIIARR